MKQPQSTEMNPRHAIMHGLEQSPMSEACMAHLRRVAVDERQRCGRPLDILEVGSLFGESAKVLAHGGRVVCVDLFEQGLERFTANTIGCHVTPFQGDSRLLLPLLPDHAYDLIFIDGDHTWPVVDNDLKQAKRLIRPGGVICGDDLEYMLTCPGDYREARPFRHVDYLTARTGYHPGVSCAVYEQFGTSVTMQDRFWWVRR